MKLWGGRFARHARDPFFEAFSESFSVDYRLVHYDLQVNRAYVEALGEAGVLNGAEVRRLVRGLEAIARRVNHSPNWPSGNSAEDVHTWVEDQLGRHAGSLAGKLRTGRSRNDLVATDARLYAKDAARELQRALTRLLESLLTKAREHRDVILPGYTHLQPAQPILFAHYLLAYFEAFSRDISRLEDCRHRADELPLAAGALAGTTFPINRSRLARQLGFKRVAANSLDATSDRDFVCELLFASALTGIHLSRLAEDLVIYASPAFGYIELADEYSTGSSIMPQKKNPDSLELIRGKAARVLGRLTGMLALLKGLPSAYNRDLQEDKTALFDGVDTIWASAELMARVLGTLRVNTARMKAAIDQGFLMATDLADELVRRGMPFAQAHKRVGQLVLYCAEHGKTFATLSADEARRFIPGWDRTLAAAAQLPERALNRRRAVGGTAPAQVNRQMRFATASLAELKRRLQTNA
jgi:argininosuccinate lyase